MSALWVFIVLFLILVAYKLVQSSKPEGFAKGVAKAQKIPYLAVKEKYPDSSKEENYARAISTRSGYDKKRAKSLVSSAKEVSKAWGEEFNFKSVVKYLVLREYQMRAGPPSSSVRDKLMKGVEDASIPSDW